MNLSRLLLIHALLTLAAGLVLIVLPDAIPGFVGVRLAPEAYLLGAAQVSLAILSYFSRRLRDRQALGLVCVTFISFHALTAVVEGYAFTQGVSARIWANIGLRVIVTMLFIYYGLKLKEKSIA